ncbi:hypothetical protein Tco_0655092 [Tanacetum coccineum]|uniref:Uncharacterized protein n=1 Tax=Tanacetum coccineum TaxID=301880 RepID=A0ABQ4X5K5_9ASTR
MANLYMKNSYVHNESLRQSSECLLLETHQFGGYPDLKSIPLSRTLAPVEADPINHQFLGADKRFFPPPGAPQGEELGLIKPLSDSSFNCSDNSFISEGANLSVARGGLTGAAHRVPNQFETPLVESEGDSASPQEILQESLEHG